MQHNIDSVVRLIKLSMRNHMSEYELSYDETFQTCVRLRQAIKSFFAKEAAEIEEASASSLSEDAVIVFDDEGYGDAVCE